jgi:hypothetical protein
MKDILKKISSKSINSYIEKNLDDFYIKSSMHPNFVSQLDNKTKWLLAKKADWPECIFRANFKSKNITKAEINHIKSLIEEGKVPNGWKVGPLTTPSNLGSILEKSGFKEVYHQSGMAIDLKKLMKYFNVQNKLKVIKIDNEDTLKQWIEIVSKVFAIRIDFELLKFLLREKEAHFYLGLFKEIPVSALMLFLSSGVAGLHAVSTLLEYRNKGFGLEISKTALIKAFNMGYHIGVLQASSLGERVYRKLGFQKYCNIYSYALEIKKK